MKAKQEELGNKILEVEQSKADFEDRLVAMYEMSRQSNLSILLGIDDFSEMLRFGENLQAISTNDTRIIQNLKNEQAELEGPEGRGGDLLSDLNTQNEQLNASMQQYQQSVQQADAAISAEEAALDAQSESIQEKSKRNRGPPSRSGPPGPVPTQATATCWVTAPASLPGPFRAIPRSRRTSAPCATSTA